MNGVPDNQTRALLEVVYRVSIHVRALSSEMTSQEIHWLMDAIHNIPHYLQSGDPDFWHAIAWSFRSYDERFSKQSGLRLVEIFQEAGGEFPADID